jgi:hypoxanthine phosphoribosyltransferase
MPAIRREALTWEEIEKLIDCLVPQFEGEFKVMVIITRGGIIPGGLLAEALGIQSILTAAVDFPVEFEREKSGLFAWPRFVEFPDDELLRGKRVMVVDDVWGSGRTITAVKNRIAAAGGIPSTCVLHFNPQRNLFGSVRPDYYAAVTDVHIVYPWEIDREPDRVMYG